jgi:hypothetical protein
VGETVAAAEAAEACEHARDSGVRQILATIAADERRHAELAWRFVGWAIRKDDRLHAVAASVFASLSADTVDGEGDRGEDLSDLVFFRPRSAARSAPA